MAVATSVVTPRAWGLLSVQRDRAVAAIHARGVSRDDAEDCVHDALLQLVTHPALDQQRVLALLTVVAMRRAYDRGRVRTREQRALQRAGRLADGAVSPAEVALDRLEAQALAPQVLRLPQRQRDVVACRAGGSSVVEAALQLGISTKAAESALGRARARLRGDLGLSSELM